MNEIEKNLSAVFAKRITEFRKEKHLTQSELAEKIGMKRGVIAYYEASAKNPTIETVQKFADFFDIPITELLIEPDKTAHPGPVSKLEKQLERIKKLPATKQKTVSAMLDGLLQETNK